MILPLAGLLGLEPAGEDAFTAPSHGPEGGLRRIFGGHVASQALVAAARTAPPERAAHSIHCAFVRPGKPGVPMRFDVARDRDGRSFTTRRVRVSQDDTVVFDMIASFHVEEAGEEWTATPRPEVPGPDQVADDQSGEARVLHRIPSISACYEWRGVHPDLPYPMWVRTVDPMPEDPALHPAVIAGMTDIASGWGTHRPGLRVKPGEFTGASLDHAVWFHRRVPPDGWLLLTMESLSNHAARGLGLGRVFAPDGTHVATWMQESLIRLLPFPSR